MEKKNGRTELGKWDQIEPKKIGSTIKCLQYADDIVFFVNNIETTQIETLKDVTAKVGFQIRFEQAEYTSLR